MSTTTKESKAHLELKPAKNKWVVGRYSAGGFLTLIVTEDSKFFVNELTGERSGLILER